MPNETVTLKLPSGEEVDAIVPEGLDDAGVKALVRMKHPDLFGPPAPAAGPHVQIQEMAGTQSLTGPAHGAGSLGPGQPEATPGMWKAGITGLSTVPAVLSGGASVPVQSAVLGLTGAAESKLEGGSNKEAAISGAIGAAIPGAGAAVQKAASYLPSAARAGKAFQEVSKVAGQHSVPVTPSLSDALMEYQSLVDAGGSRSLAVSKLVNRLTTSGKGPLTYDEARLFASNISRLSADDAQRLTPVMKRAVGQVASELSGTISNTAEAAGKLEAYQAAMREWGQVKTMEDRLKILKKYGIRAGLYALGGGAATAGGKLAYEMLGKQ